MGICKLCDEEQKLIKAHIIPEAFFRNVTLKENEIPKIYSNINNYYPKKAPIGIYDENILCLNCEKKFGDWDEYAIKILLYEEFKTVKYNDKREKGGFFIKNYDYLKMKLFIISLIWRASVSSHSFYCNVKLGPFEKKAKQMIIDQNPGEQDEFAAMVFKFEGKNQVEILNPVRNKTKKVNTYRFFFGKYGIIVKVDSQSTPVPFNKFIMKRDKELIVLKREFENSPEFDTTIEIAKSTNKY